jgi:predicted MFS family arabinose efflux permease
MTSRFRAFWTTAPGRGFVLLALMQVAYGFAQMANTSTVEDVLHFSGPQFGYMTAIREVGGLTLILLMALLYRISIQRLTAGAMLLLAVGYGLFGVATGFASVIPWILISSFGLHTVLQTQYSLGMSLTTQERSGHVLGRMAAFAQGGTLAALIVVILVFHFHVLSYERTYLIVGVVAFVGALAIIGFPHLHEGEERKAAPKREPIVWRRDYRYYYALNLLDGVRQQIFFSFGLWVLVNRFGLTVVEISEILLIVTAVAIFLSSYIGRLFDRLGERRVLQAINIGYVVALGGYALVNSVYLACLFFLMYSFIQPFSTIGASTYLRKIALPEEIAPSLAMGVTLLHATAVVVPVVAGIILHYVGYKVPFFIACLSALVMVGVTQRLNPLKQRCPARVALDEARLAAQIVKS